MKQTWRGRRAWLVVLLPVLVLVGGATAWAQKTVGEVRGTVTDTSGGRRARRHREPHEREHRLHARDRHGRQGRLRRSRSWTPGRTESTSPLRQLQEVQPARSPSARSRRPACRSSSRSAGSQETVEVTAAARGRQRDERRRRAAPQKEVLEMPNLNHYGFSNATLMPAIAAVRGAARDDQRVGRGQQLEPQRVLHRRRRGHRPLARLVAAAAGGGRLRGDRRQHGRRHGGRRLQLRRHVQRRSSSRAPTQFHGSAWYYFRDKRPERQLVGQQPCRPREARRPAEVLGRPGRRPDHQGQAVLLLDGEPRDGQAAVQPDRASSRRPRR